MTKKKTKDGKVMRTFRLAPDTIARLEELAKATAKTKTQVVEELIHIAEVGDEQ